MELVKEAVGRVLLHCELLLQRITDDIGLYMVNGGGVVQSGILDGRSMCVSGGMSYGAPL